MNATVSKDQRPGRRHGFSLLRVGDQWVIVDASGSAVCTLNTTAAAIWELCDGATRVDEMIAAICELAGASSEAIEPDVVAALEQFQHHGLLR